MGHGFHLGISAYYHDSAAALVKDGLPFAAAQEERFSRKRYDSRFPGGAIRYCLAEAGIEVGDLASVTYYEDSAVKLGRVLSSFASAGPRGIGTFGRIAGGWAGWKRHAHRRIGKELEAIGAGCPEVQTVPHHKAHAASAFYPSPFQSAAVLCIDSVGEWHTTTIWHGQGNTLELCNSVSYPHSLGLLYSTFTEYCGFKVDSGEYKLMGLAPYGEPLYVDRIRDHVVHLRDDGSFSINLAYFDFLRGRRMSGPRLWQLFDGPPRPAESSLSQRECDIAASIQVVINDAVLNLARAALEMTGESRLCMAGGVSLNCVANGVLSRSGLAEGLWIQPAAGDAGGALGAALLGYYRSPVRRKANEQDDMQGALLGPGYSAEQVRLFVEEGRYPFHAFAQEDAFWARLVSLLEAGKVVGWFQGRMEFGPRALGARSIIGDPRQLDMQKRMNLQIKFRESFRPFAPSVLAEEAEGYFQMCHDSPYMLIVSPVAKAHQLHGVQASGLGTIGVARSTLPAITHVDMSARVQTVSEDSNPRYHELLKRFFAATGCPVLVNTSFNVRGEPIVCSPADAYRCFMRTHIDVLVLENIILLKEEQPELEGDANWREEIPLD